MTAVQRAAFLEESNRLDSVAALNVARGVSVARSGSPEAWQRLVAHASGSETMGEIQRYRAEVEQTKAQVEAAHGPA